MKLKDLKEYFTILTIFGIVLGFGYPAQSSAATFVPGNFIDPEVVDNVNDTYQGPIGEEDPEYYLDGQKPDSAAAEPPLENGNGDLPQDPGPNEFPQDGNNSLDTANNNNLGDDSGLADALAQNGGCTLGSNPPSASFMVWILSLVFALAPLKFWRRK